jgi:anti-sigma factor ChrR (cupin superfamily)
MKIAADFDKKIVVHSASAPWIASPMAGVFRRPLDRVGAEVARATSIVRYAPGSHFSPHVHTGGEEFIVLEGVFQDEHGDFPAGSYIRNPPQSRHTPGSEAGCIILVKLWQFQPEDRTQVRININEIKPVLQANNPELLVTSLFNDEFEQVSILDIQPNAIVKLEPQGGAELFVLQGSANEQDTHLLKHSWLRLPIGDPVLIKAGQNGVKIWLKTGHLRDVQKQIQRINKAKG